jgi:hypothetical protein
MPDALRTMSLDPTSWPSPPSSAACRWSMLLLEIREDKSESICLTRANRFHMSDSATEGKRFCFFPALQIQFTPRNAVTRRGRSHPRKIDPDVEMACAYQRGAKMSLSLSV